MTLEPRGDDRDNFYSADTRSVASVVSRWAFRDVVVCPRFVSSAQTDDERAALLLFIVLRCVERTGKKKKRQMKQNTTRAARRVPHIGRHARGNLPADHDRRRAVAKRSVSVGREIVNSDESKTCSVGFFLFFSY